MYSICGAFPCPFMRGFNVTDLMKNESSSLCRQPNVEKQVQSGARLKAPTNSLCKSASVGQFVPNKYGNK